MVLEDFAPKKQVESKYYPQKKKNQFDWRTA